MDQRHPYLVSGMMENDFILLALCQNGASDLVDGKLWVSMPLNRNGFTMLICATFRPSINVPLTVLKLVSHIICMMCALHHG